MYMYRNSFTFNMVGLLRNHPHNEQTCVYKQARIGQITPNYRRGAFKMKTSKSCKLSSIDFSSAYFFLSQCGFIGQRLNDA